MKKPKKKAKRLPTLKDVRMVFEVILQTVIRLANERRKHETKA